MTQNINSITDISDKVIAQEIFYYRAIAETIEVAIVKPSSEEDITKQILTVQKPKKRTKAETKNNQQSKNNNKHSEYNHDKTQRCNREVTIHKMIISDNVHNTIQCKLQCYATPQYNNTSNNNIPNMGNNIGTNNNMVIPPNIAMLGQQQQQNSIILYIILYYNILYHIIL